MCGMILLTGPGASYFDISEPNFAAVILEQDVPLQAGPETWRGFKFARSDGGLNLVAAAVVFEDLNAIKPVLDVIAFNQNPRGVDFPNRTHRRFHERF